LTGGADTVYEDGSSAAVRKRFAKIAKTNFQESNSFIEKYVISESLLIDKI